MKTMIAIMATMAGLSGCASITGDTAQHVRVETVNQDGAVVAGAKCTMQNNFGTTSGDSGTQILTRRSSENLHIECKKDGYPDAQAAAISRANGGMWGNIIFGGGIGAVIDHNKGTAYTYPEWIRLVFGKVLTFDRFDDKTGQPSLAKEVPDVKQEPSAIVSAQQMN